MTALLTASQFQTDAGIDDTRMARLNAYATLLEKWQKKINLVSKSTLADKWRRHFMDSAQLVPLIPEDAKILVDLGSGAGFPGLVIAALTDLEVHLVDSDTRKGVFMREAARAMGVNATVHTGRIENMDPIAADVVTSRALAPLDALLTYAQPFRKAGTTCLFLKGKTSEDELTHAGKEWTMTAKIVPSVTDPAGVIIQLTDFFQQADDLV